MVKQFFKPDIYHELYEVDVYSNGNKNNSVYQYYRNMIPNNMPYPSNAGGTAAPGGSHNDSFKANDLMNSVPPPQNPNNAVVQQIANNYQQQ